MSNGIAGFSQLQIICLLAAFLCFGVIVLVIVKVIKMPAKKKPRVNANRPAKHRYVKTIGRKRSVGSIKWPTVKVAAARAPNASHNSPMRSPPPSTNSYPYAECAPWSKVLVPYDDGPSAIRAVEYACSIVASNGEIILWSLVGDIITGRDEAVKLSANELEEAYGPQIAEMRATLEGVAAGVRMKVEPRGVTVRTILDTNPALPSVLLPTQVISLDVELVCMGNKGKTSPPESICGATAHAMIANPPCAVAVIRDDAEIVESGRHILVAYNEDRAVSKKALGQGMAQIRGSQDKMIMMGVATERDLADGVKARLDEYAATVKKVINTKVDTVLVESVKGALEGILASLNVLTPTTIIMGKSETGSPITERCIQKCKSPIVVVPP